MPETRDTPLPPPGESATPRRRRTTEILLACAMVAAVVAVYFPALSGMFLWDDWHFLVEHPLILAPDGLYRFWFTREAPDYFPLANSILWMEWRAWGMDPLGYHVVNVAFHILNALLLWRLLLLLRIPGAWLGAMIFALHPVAVQSVAWIYELKNVLAMLFMLLTALAWFRYDEDRRRRHYVAALVFFLLGLLAKSAIVVLPAALLLCSWWRRGSIDRRHLIDIAPFFALALLMGLVTVRFQQHGMTYLPETPLQRLLCVTWALAFYLYKAFLPLDLCFMYTRWQIDPASPWAWAPLLLLIALAAVLWWRRRDWGRPVAVALGCHALLLLPVLGFVNMSLRNYTFVADYLQYFSLPAVAALAGAALWSHAGAGPQLRNRVAVGAAVAILAALGWMSWTQAHVYKSISTVWDNIHALNSRSLDLHRTLARVSISIGRKDQAVYHLRHIVKMQPQSAEAHNNLGMVWLDLGHLDDALKEMQIAVQLRPDDPRLRANLQKVIQKREAAGSSQP